jgi:glycosyltransferase involved in cell wall biosynthesis
MLKKIDRANLLVRRGYSFIKRRGFLAFLKRLNFELRMRCFSRHPGSDENVTKFLKAQNLYLRAWEERTSNRLELLKFSIIVPVYKSDLKLLDTLVSSILGQTYRNWELILIDDGSAQPNLTDFLRSLAASDSRIFVIANDKNLGISAATNFGLTSATGDFICLADHDDFIHPSSLALFADQLNNDPKAGWIYSDEAKISADSKRIYDLFFKPDWSPYYLLTCMYTAHFAAYRSDLIKDLQFRTLYDGAQDYDFALRLSRRISDLDLNVLHVPFILYYWRAIPGSTALSMEEKPLSSNTGLLLLQDFVSNLQHIEKIVPNIYKGSYSVIAKKLEEPISIIIPTALRTIKGSLLLQDCISSIEESNPPLHTEIIVVLSKDDSVPEICTKLKLEWVHDTDSNVNIARKMNIGSQNAKFKVLAFINDDILLDGKHTLQTLAGFLRDPNIGSVAPKLLYPNDCIQCAGVALNIDTLPDHVSRGSHKSDPGYYFSAVGQREVTANTGAFFLVLNENFGLVNGFNEELAVNYNDIDLSLRLAKLKKSNLMVNYLTATHLESASRIPEVRPEEEQIFLASWANFQERFYPCHLQTQPPNYSLLGFNSNKVNEILEMQGRNTH